MLDVLGAEGDFGLDGSSLLDAAHPRAREKTVEAAYKRILESQSNFRVVAMASNGEEAVQKAAESAPDVAILDIRMPKVDGIKVYP